MLLLKVQTQAGLTTSVNDKKESLRTLQSHQPETRTSSKITRAIFDEKGARLPTTRIQPLAGLFREKRSANQKTDLINRDQEAITKP
jgi:hypothetical protein